MTMARRGVADWNAWRGSHLRVQPDLTRIDLSGRDLRNMDLRGVGLFKANLAGVDLRGANLRQSIMIGTNLRGADLTGAHVYGASVWDVALDGARLLDLVITPPGAQVITTDSLQMAQFLYMLCDNAALRDVIETLTARVVLLLGRFTPSRKSVLEAVKAGLREAGFVPVLFDFAGPGDQTPTDTVRTIATKCRAVIADLTDAASVPWELAKVTTVAPRVRIIPILEEGSAPFAMFQDIYAEHPATQPIESYVDLSDVRTRLVPALLSRISTP